MDRIAHVLNAVYLHGKSGGQEHPLVEGAMTIAEGIEYLTREPVTKEMAPMINTDELIQELFSRYESGVIGLVRPDARDGKLKQYKLRWEGDCFTAQGMAAAIIENVNHYRREHEEVPDEDS